MIALAPIRKTETGPRLSGGEPGQRECWAAETADGLWRFERLDDEPNTPWAIFHKPSEADRSWLMPVVRCGNLKACRRSVAMGFAAQELESLKAEENS